MQRSGAVNRHCEGKVRRAPQRASVALLLAAFACSCGAVPARAGTVYAWGSDQYGQLGNGMTINGGVNSPVEVVGIENVRAIASGFVHSLALKSDGTVWAWGADGYGDLGSEANTTSNVPLEVSGLSDVTAIAALESYSLALKTDGTVWAWGANLHGALGDGTTTESSVPVEVSGLSDVVAVAGGDGQSMALKKDGTVWAWGNNYYGELGNGTTTDSHVPVKVGGLSGVTAIACGSDHGLALEMDGTVWAWGYNGDGELGNGTTTDGHVPVEVNGLSGVTTIAGGDGISLALKTDGTVWAWGDNRYGELGNGTTANSDVPTKVSGLSGITAISAGGLQGLALKADGTVWAWGDNDDGELGNGTTVGSHVPVEVSDLSGVIAIAAGFAQGQALVNDTPTPTTKASISGTAGQNGWYSGPVTVTLSATDPDNSPAQIVTYYSLDSGTQQTYTTPFTISNDGKHVLSFWSVDVAGDQEATQALNISIDSTPPTLSFGAPSPAANPAGWNNSTVDIPFTTADSGSGVTSVLPPTPLQFSVEGKNQTQGVKVTDKAGNSATFTSPPVNIDVTPPVTTLSFTGPAGADSSSFTGPVQVKLAATDNLSGVSATHYTLDGGPPQTYTQPFNIAADGRHTIIYWSVDAAGNQETMHTQAALVDTSMPAITITSPQNQVYLLNQVVDAAYTGADTEDGITPTTGPVPSGSPIDTSSVGVKTFTVKATDTAGNSSQASVSYTVSYGVKLLYDPTMAAPPGAPLPVSLQLVDAAGNNVSSPGVTLHAVSITRPGDQIASGSGPAFTFDPMLGGTGGYVFNLNTTSLSAGALSLNFVTGNDPTVHQALFTIAGPTVTLPTGISLVSVPLAETGDLAALLGVPVLPDGAADIAIYDSVTSQYLLYPHLPGVDGKSGLPGRGYWVEEKSPTLLPSSGAANSSPLDISLSPGWNMIGDPYAVSLTTGSLQLAVGSGQPTPAFMSEAAAISAGVMDGTIWAYDTGAKQYTAANTLTPFEGYWIYIDPPGSGGQPVTLRFTVPDYQGVPVGT